MTNRFMKTTASLSLVLTGPLVLAGALLPAVAAQVGAGSDAAAGAHALSGTDAHARAVVRHHADACFRLHGECLERARALQRAVVDLLAAPDAERLAAARAAWSHARLVYGRIEALRFRGGPIEELEPLLNAWPVDEAYIEHVAYGAAGGIVHDRQTWRALSAPLLEHANERGSETNVSVGWHAIEFLLWGRDTFADGPGRRAHTDFVDGEAVDAERRRAYLRIVTDQLVAHLAQLERAWAPDADNHRRRFEADVRGSVRAMLTGAAILTAFELCGERLAVAYETQDQEQEHSCFSDTTCADLVANQLGIVAVLDGDGAGDEASVIGLVRRRDPEIAAHLESCLAETLVAMRAIPQPFDQAFLGDDDAPGRRAILTAMRALEQQAEAIAIAGRLLGHELPMRPGN